jgi:hypothetical protein
MNGWQTFIQIALPCLKFSPQIALSDDIKQVKRDLRIIEQGAKGNVTEECKTLSRKYFYYADWLMKEKNLKMDKDSFEYFFKYHNCTPSANLRSIGKKGELCKTRVVELIDKRSLKVQDLTNKEIFKAEKDFIPGSAILENLNKLNQLVLMSKNPKVYLLNPNMRKIIKNNLKKINFKIGPWIDLNGKYYITHWGVLCYKLTPSKLSGITSSTP